MSKSKGQVHDRAAQAASSIPFYAGARSYEALKPEIDAAITGVLSSGTYFLGPALERFESALASHCGVQFAAGVNSGTDALWMTFHALGVRPGDEIITTANTFFATAEAIWIAGAKAVFVDIDPATRVMDPLLLDAAITPRTVGIVPVHLYGLCADMRSIAKIAARHGLWIVEDNAQAIDSHGPGWMPGQLSSAVTTSFISHKNLGCCGDGGAVLTNRRDLDESIRRMRNHGTVARATHAPGFNSRLDDLQAGILSVKLPRLRAMTDRRRAIAAAYNDAFAGLDLVRPVEPPGYRHVFHLYVIETAQRDSLADHLARQGVATRAHYPIPIHKQAGYPWDKPTAALPPLPFTEKSAARCLSLPLYPELSDAEVDIVIAACRRWAEHRSPI